MKIRRLRSGICLTGFAAAGVKSKKEGIALILADRLCKCAGVFTKNTVKAAPVSYTKNMVGKGVRAVVVNSGNANACTPTGLKDAKSLAAYAAKVLDVNRKNVALASTGIIGKPLNVKNLEKSIEYTAKKLKSSSNASLSAAKAIMTTDTKPKMTAYEYNGVIIGGICKGSGMIAPNMGTMLCFLTTNADLPRGKLQKALKNAVINSFNMLVVDDISTNDTVLLLSDSSKKCSYSDFKKLLDYILLDFVEMMAEDAEGASKSIKVTVKGAKDALAARKAAKAVVSSNLVKTAVYGETPNWGRIANKLGEKIKVDVDRLDITFKSKTKTEHVVKGGNVRNIKNAVAVLKSRKIHIIIDLHLGRAHASAWGCDLTPEYIRINAKYN